MGNSRASDRRRLAKPKNRVEQDPVFRPRFAGCGGAENWQLDQHAEGQQQQQVQGFSV